MHAHPVDYLHWICVAWTMPIYNFNEKLLGITKNLPTLIRVLTE